MGKLYNFCRQKVCPLINNAADDEFCIFNLIIYQNDTKTLFYNLSEKRIFIIEKGFGLSELTFQETIRVIDTIPTENSKWKRTQILKLAKDLGFFGIN